MTALGTAWRLLGRHPGTWAAVALLLAFYSSGSVAARTTTGVIGKFQEQIMWLGVWGALMGALLAARDRLPGLSDVIGSTPVSRWAYVLRQALGLVPLLLVALAATFVGVWWPHKPELTGFWPARLAESSLPFLAGAVTLMWLGLTVGHALRGPLVFIAPVLLAVVAVSWSRALPHTLSFFPEARCSELVGCPPLPYAAQAAYLLAVGGVLLGLAVLAARWLALHQSRRGGWATWGTLAVSALLIAVLVPPLTRAAAAYPRWDWRAAPPWPAVDPERPDLAAAQVPAAAYACTGAAPQVCMPHSAAALGQRLQRALVAAQHLRPGWEAPRVSTYPDLSFAGGSRLLGNTLYVSEGKVLGAVPNRVTSAIFAGGKKTERIVILPDDLTFLQARVLHALRGTLTSGPQPRRMADGSIRLAGEPLDAVATAEHYAAWVTLRGDERAGEIVKILQDPGTFLAQTAPQIRRLWARGEVVGHEKLARALLEAAQSGRLSGPAKNAETFAQGVK